MQSLKVGHEWSRLLERRAPPTHHSDYPIEPDLTGLWYTAQDTEECAQRWSTGRLWWEALQSVA